MPSGWASSTTLPSALTPRRPSAAATSSSTCLCVRCIGLGTDREDLDRFGRFEERHGVVKARRASRVSFQASTTFRADQRRRLGRRDQHRPARGQRQLGRRRLAIGIAVCDASPPATIRSAAREAVAMAGRQLQPAPRSPARRGPRSRRRRRSAPASCARRSPCASPSPSRPPGCRSPPSKASGGIISAHRR